MTRAGAVRSGMPQVRDEISRARLHFFDIAKE
jgi:hypothetical protein